MIQKDLPAAVRTVTGKGPMRRLRMDKKTPGVVYSKGNTTVSLQFDTALLFKQLLAIRGRNAVVNLQVQGDDKETRHVLVKEIQKDPVDGGVVHIDFQEILLDKERTFTVPINYTGTAKGVDLGGELQVMRSELTLKGQPLDIPDSIDVDVTKLVQGGPGINLNELVLPQGATMLDKGDVLGVIVR